MKDDSYTTEQLLNNPSFILWVEGEAYFSITPKKEKKEPKFIIETKDGSASVWGTRFTMDTCGAWKD